MNLTIAIKILASNCIKDASWRRTRMRLTGSAALANRKSAGKTRVLLLLVSWPASGSLARPCPASPGRAPFKATRARGAP